jgi:assimilatory nitrate reductase catalytic subunit
VLTRQELDFNAVDYWVKIKGEQFYRYELAGEKRPENLANWAKSYFDSDETGQWQEYQDSGTNHYRAAHIIDQRLESVVFISPTLHLPERNWLTSLFAKPALTESERKSLLTGKPPLGVPDVGTIICACFTVGEKTIRAAIAEKNLTTHQEVGQCLKAGTNCGSCIPEIKALL